MPSLDGAPLPKNDENEGKPAHVDGNQKCCSSLLQSTVEVQTFYYDEYQKQVSDPSAPSDLRPPPSPTSPSMNFSSYAFAPSTPLSLPFTTLPPLKCIRRRTTSPPAKITPTATRATLTPDPSPTPPVNTSSVTPSPLQASIDHLSPADQNRILAVRSQMEFWFSASNLRRDWYLRRQMDQEGWLDPSTFLRFNRIRSLRATLHDIILACSISDELEVSSPDSSFGDVEGQTRIRRSPTLPDFREWDEDELPRSFIMKRIPTDSTVETLQAILEPMASPSYIRIYRSKGPAASTAALICFEDVPTADAVFTAFAADTRPEVKGIIMKRRIVTPDGPEQVIPGEPSPGPKPTLLVIQVTNLPVPLDWKTLYEHLGKLFMEKAAIPVRYLLFEQGASSCYITVADNPATRSMIKDFVDDAIPLNDTTCSVRLLENPKEVQEYWLMATAHQAKRKARRTGKQGVDPDSEGVLGRFPQGVILRIEGFEEDTTWRGIKADLEEMARLVYLSFNRKTGSCYARFGSPDEARAVTEAISGESAKQICGASVKAYILYGEEEEEYWQRAEKIRKEKLQRKEGKEGSNANGDEKTA